MTSTHQPSPGTQRFAWCLYDFANSAFPTVIVTAVYVLYFKGVVVGNTEPGRSDNLWGAANSLAAALVFLTAPLLGAAADLGGKKRAFLIAFASISIASTAGLYFTGQGTVLLAMSLMVLAVFGFEGSCVFYNAFLPDLAPPEKMGRLSGYGWALGYMGGLGCLLAILPIAESHTRLVPLVVAAWFLVFSLPAFVLLRDRVKPQAAQKPLAVLKKGGSRLVATVGEIRNHRPMLRFLASYFFYNNAVITIIVFAVAFSSETLGFTTKQSIALMVVMNVIAAPGALAFGWLADRMGAKRTLIATLIMWLLVVAGAQSAAWPELFTAEQAKSVFWGVAALASLCIGAVQATSRSFVGQMAPDGRSGEFYGFMAFAGKGSAILGPLVFGLAADVFDSQRVAVATIGVFFAVGLLLLFRVPEQTAQ